MTAISELLNIAAERGVKYAENASRREVAPTPNAVAALAGLREKFPELPSDPLRVIQTLDEVGSPATVASTGGRYFGFVIGGTLPAAMAASWLAGAWGQNVALRVMSPVAA